MKRIIAILLSLVITVSLFQGCSVEKKEATAPSSSNVTTDTAKTTVLKDTDLANSFSSMDNPKLLDYLDSTVYSEILETIDNDKYFVENVETMYLSQEYLEELEYNSKENEFFGYKLSDVQKQFKDKKFVFTLGEDGKTTVKEFENYDDTVEKIIRNVAIGTGVILFCVTLSAVTGGVGLPAASMILAASAKTATVMALSSGAIATASTAIFTAMETNDMNTIVKSSLLSGSDGFKWGAITGAITGGIGKFTALRGATAKGLNMNQVATIQKESKYPLDVIKNFSSMKQYEFCKKTGLYTQLVNGKTALVRKINLKQVDEFGRTNLERMQKGLAALDKNGIPYEIHHVGQEAESTFAILTKEEHRLGDNNKLWHVFGEKTKTHGAGSTWDKQRSDFWKSFAKIVGSEK